MKIDGKQFLKNMQPYIIAEISGNHGGDIKNAFRLIKEAKKAGADAVKTQCYEPDTITLKCNKLDFIIQEGLWKGRTLHELYSKSYTPFSWHKDLYQCAKDEGITIFSSAFDFSSVDLLEHLGCPAYKIASFEIVDIPLIQYATKTGKPLIISTGMATKKEILDANEAAQNRAAFLHCTSEYPGTVNTANLRRITEIDRLLNHDAFVGISDHTHGHLVPVMATALKATIIEKHIMLEDTASEDGEFSMTPKTFSVMVQAVSMAWQAMQPRDLHVQKQLRRSIYAVKDIKEGETFSLKNVRSIRPGYGLPPSKLSWLLGRKTNKAYRRGDPISS